MDGLGGLFGEELEGPQLAGLFEEAPAAEGFAPTVRLRGPSNFTGLRNQGATCYLNSLIQALYMTPEFREMIYGLSQAELGLDEGEDAPSEENGADSAADIPHEESLPPNAVCMVSELASMGFGEQLATRALLHSMQGSTASMERAIEWLFDPSNANASEKLAQEESAPPAAKSSKKKRKRKRVRKIPAELQRLFAQLQLSDKHAVSTEELTDSFGWKGRESYQQHDVQELNRLLFEAIEASLKRTSGDGKISELYQGSMVSNVKCKGCEKISHREEHFEDVTVLVNDRASLVDSLSHAFEVELLEGDNQYFCDGCDCKHDAERWTAFGRLPPVLIFSLLRFEYSYETQERTKNCSTFEYPLSMDLRGLGWAPDDTPQEECLYDLFSVIVHTGAAASSGHYHAYIRDLLQEGSWAKPGSEESTVADVGATEASVATTFDAKYSSPPGEVGKSSEEDSLSASEHCTVIAGDVEGWFDFNDSSVEPVTGGELRKQFGGLRECAYMLVYRKRLLNKTFVTPIVPEGISLSIAAENGELKAKVAEDEMKFYKTEVVVYTERQFYVDASGVARLVPDSEIGMLLSIDRRLSVSHLKDTILLMLEDEELDQLGSGEVVLEQISVLDELLVSKGRLESANTMDDAGVRTGMDVLLWNGSSLNGNHWDPKCKSVRLAVDWFSVQLESESATIVSLLEDGLPVRKHAVVAELSSQDRLSTLYGLVAHQVNLLPEEILLFVVRDGEAIPLLDMDLSLQALKIETGCKVSGELRRNPYGEGSLAEGKMSSITQTMVLNVISKLGEEESMYIVYAPASLTLAEVKRPLLAREQKEESTVKTRFRHIERLGHEGSLFSTEHRSLRGSGLQNESNLILEHGRAPDAPQMSVTFYVARAEDVSYNIDIEKDWTVEEAKAAMMSLAHVDPSCNYRLRKTDGWGAALGVVGNELKSVRQSGLSNECVLLLEPGDTPKTGQVSVTVKLYEYRDFEASRALASSACSLLQPVKLLNDASLGGENTSPQLPVVGTTPVSVTPPSEAGESTPSDLEGSREESRAQEMKAGHSSAALRVDGWQDGSAWELYSPALAHGSTAPRSFAVTTMGSVVVEPSKTLHEFKEQLLKEFPLLAGLSPLQLRLWCKARVLKHSDRSLSAQYVGNRSCLVLQALEEEEVFLDADAGLVWLCVYRRNTAAACFDRPVEYLFNQKQAGLAGRSLHSCLARDLGIPAEYLSLARYVPASDVWQAVGRHRSAPKAVLPRKPGGRKWKKQKTCAFKDGDILAYKDLRESPDAFLSHVSGLAPKTRPLLGGQRTKGSSMPASSRRREAQLRIFVDAFDDEDDEEGEDESEEDVGGDEEHEPSIAAREDAVSLHH